MNHGLINRHIYSIREDEQFNIYYVYPELEKLKNYFGRLRKRDKYYNAMKYHAVHLAYKIHPGLILEQIAEIINAKDHATALFYLKEYMPLEGHQEFIANNFDNFVSNFLYPLTPIYKEVKEYGLYKPTYIAKGEIPSMAPKKARKKYIYKVGRSAKEKYQSNK